MSDDRMPPADERDLDEVTAQLDRYVSLSDADPSPGFADRVMRDVALAPEPRRSLLWVLAHPRRMTRALQLTAAAAVLVLAAAGTIAGGQLAGLLRHSASPAATPTIVASPSPSPTPSPRPTPTESDGPSQSLEASATEDVATGGQSSEPSDGAATAHPSGSNDHESPEPGSSQSPQAGASQGE